MSRTVTVDVLIVGAGPAGLSAAARLASTGAGRVEVLERDPVAGGVPHQCHHGGFGLRELGGTVQGPVYARRLVDAAVRAGATVRTGVTATGWAGPLTLDTTSPAGLERITARAVVLATGARERPRSARLVPGSRPAGVLTTGELQRTVHLHGMAVGHRAVVVGGEPVAHRAARTLAGAGVTVAAVITEHPGGPLLRRLPFPVLTGTTISELVGRGRLTGVRVRHRDGRTGTLGCDTVVFTGDWIPDHELARYGGLVLDPGTRGPSVDASFRTTGPGVFAVGNALHGVERAGTAAAEGRAVAASVLRHLRGADWPARGVALVAQDPLAWVTPNRITGPDAGGFLVRAGRPGTSGTVTFSQDGRVLHHARLRGPASPSRSVRVAAGWASGVDLSGGPVVVDVV